jgi:hypothetical protein
MDAGVVEDLDGETVCRQRGGRPLEALRGRRIGEHGSERPGRAGRRARQRSGVEVPDLVDPLGELPPVAGALVMVVVDGEVQALAAVAGAGELLDVGTAGRRSPPVRISSRPISSAGMLGIRSAPFGVNSDARRARSRIIAASVNSPKGDGP